MDRQKRWKTVRESDKRGEMGRFSGSEMRELRKRLGKSQAEMADEFDVQRQTIVRWEAEDALPKLVRMALAAWAYGLPAKGDRERA